MMFSRGKFVISVAESDAGQRLDSLVSSNRSDCSRSFAAALIQDGRITIENQKRKPGYRVKPGEKIQGCIPEYEPPSLQAEALSLNILFEDRHLIVIDKPAGMVVHPAPGNDTGTLVNGLLYHCPELGGINAEMRPGSFTGSIKTPREPWWWRKTDRFWKT